MTYFALFVLGFVVGFIAAAVLMGAGSRDEVDRPSGKWPK